MVKCEHDPNTKLDDNYHGYSVTKYEEYSNTTAITIFQKDVNMID